MARWLAKEAILAIHAELIDEHGGRQGLRDEALLESALARPRNLAAYSREASMFDLAAALAFGLSRNHPFIDGNKRISLMAAYVFLRLNGWRLVASELDAVATISALAAGELDQVQLAAWLETNAMR